MPSLAANALGTALGIFVDAYRTCAWVRRHDVVIVPGMGVLEATLPLRPWRTPYLMFLTCLSGRVFGTRVALVSVGANVIKQQLTQASRRRGGTARALSIVPRRRLAGCHEPDGARGLR